MAKLTKKEEVLKLRAAESVIEDLIDYLNETLETVAEALQERGEVPNSESDTEVE